MNEEQQRIHDALLVALPLEGALTGWIVAYESLPADGTAAEAGHFYGPESMTTWRAIGLLEWVNRFCLRPDEEE